MSPYSTPRKVRHSAKVNLLTNLHGSPEMVSKIPKVAILNATRRQIYDKVLNMRESPLKLKTTQPGVSGVKRKRVSKWSDEQEEFFSLFWYSGNKPCVI